MTLEVVRDGFARVVLGYSVQNALITFQEAMWQRSRRHAQACIRLWTLPRSTDWFELKIMKGKQTLPVATSASGERVRVTIELSRETLEWIEDLRVQLGFRSRGFIIEQLLSELRSPSDSSGLGRPRDGSGLLARASRFLGALRSRIPFL